VTPFDEALQLTLGYEGGISNDKADRGGLTQAGITQRTYDAWRRVRRLPLRAVTLIEPEEVRTIYFQLYWLAAHCDELPGQLAKCVFDASVNHGPTRAIRLLQLSIGITDDGQFGPQTRRALEHADENATITIYLDAREDFYADIIEADPTQVRFKDGWRNRVIALRAALETDSHVA